MNSYEEYLKGWFRFYILSAVFCFITAIILIISIFYNTNEDTFVFNMILSFFISIILVYMIVSFIKESVIYYIDYNSITEVVPLYEYDFISRNKIKGLFRGTYTYNYLYVDDYFDIDNLKIIVCMKRCHICRML